jgi:predicted  nucleic acid-binding Zn-ribbon protein
MSEDILNLPMLPVYTLAAVDRMLAARDTEILALKGMSVSLSEQLASIEGRLASLTERMINLEGRCVSLEERVAALLATLELHTQKLSSQGGRLQKIERAIGLVT